MKLNSINVEQNKAYSSKSFKKSRDLDYFCHFVIEKKKTLKSVYYI